MPHISIILIGRGVHNSGVGGELVHHRRGAKATIQSLEGDIRLANRVHAGHSHLLFK